MTPKEFQQLYNKSLEIAFEAHKGQLDKGGESYIMHPIRVSQKCKTPQAKIVALLHDVLEDSNITTTQLHELGIPEEIISWVLILTKEPNKEYKKYIVKVGNFDITTEVKLADLEDNMNISRLHEELTEKDYVRLRKYKKAYEYLKGNYSIYDKIK